ncbi:MAG: aspartate 1-decarboxylase [Bacteroidetes bacterium]|nr:aspartate 1-decarboxylase [Bacteroidota bacterium]
MAKLKWALSSKIQKAIVTEANLAYVGSITIDEDLIEKSGLWPGERVLVVSNTSGSRLETYVIKGARGSGAIHMNGAAAHLIKRGEELIIMGFTLTDEPITPKNVLVDPHNRFVRFVTEEEKMILSDPFSDREG